MKTIYNARDEVEAQMICSYLADAGIDSYATDSYFAIVLLILANIG